jgi:hypothetical protein
MTDIRHCEERSDVAIQWLVIIEMKRINNARN